MNSISLAALMVLVPVMSKGIQLNSEVGYFEPLSVKASFVTAAQYRMAAKFEFFAHGRPFKLHLRTHQHLFHPDFHLITIGRNGVRKKTVPNMKHHVLGHLTNEKGSVAYGKIINNTFDGIIHTKLETYFLEPLDRHPLGHTHPGYQPSHNMIMYKMRDVNYTLPRTHCEVGTSEKMRKVQLSAQFNDVDDSSTFTHNLLRKKRQSAANDRTCTVHAVADYRFYSQVGGLSESNTMDEMILHVQNADYIYQTTIFEGNNGNIAGSRFYMYASEIYKSEDSSNPLLGEYSTSELLEAFSQQDFDDVCLGHLFTYRDFQGTIGLAYLGDPNGQLAGGICQKRTRTSIGDANLNTGFTSLLNYGKRLSRAVSLITTAHEFGHNHGAEHDSGECVDQQYIMYPYATSGATTEFSSCSKRSIGRTIETRGSCFVEYPSSAVCGNGIIEDDEECDCGTTTIIAQCELNDPCCTLNCTLKDSANCTSQASSCCVECQPANDVTLVCFRGDENLEDGGCQNDTYCEMNNPNCPIPIPEPDGTVCNNGSNVCEGGACTGSPCSLISVGSSPCSCEAEEQLCHVCCEVDGVCKSSFELLDGNGYYVLAGFPCLNFSGYCSESHECKGVNNDDVLNNLRDILLDFTSILNWVKENWYWVLVGLAVVVILIILLQVTYRRKKLPGEEQSRSCCGFGKKRQLVGTREENSGLLLRQSRT